MQRGIFKMNALCLFVLFACANICVGQQKEVPISDLQNVNIDCKVDLSTHIVKITTDIAILNYGNSGVRLYVFGLTPSAHKHLSFLGATLKDGSNTALVVAPVTLAQNKDGVFFGITFPSAIGPGKTVRITVDTVFVHALRPFPVEILQSEKQYVVYESNLYYFSPYTTHKQTTTVQTATATIESYTKTKPTAVKENTITYGPYNDVAPFSQGSVRVHYENNSPFLTVTDLVRVIEVSHWGNVAVEEHVDIYHSGAKLKGPFSRYHYQRMQDGASSVRSFKTILPASASDVYYRDEIGNISTSNMKEMDDAVEVELRPRFPLFGGWKTHYYIGYNVPSYEYIYNLGDEYVLKMRFVDHIIDDQVIDHATVRIILPEGSSHIDVKSPYSVNREKDETHYTYLDTLGRPVVVLSKSKLVEQHIVNFETIVYFSEECIIGFMYMIDEQVHYKFRKWMLLQEPLLVVAAFYLLCLVVIIYVRLDFSITKDEAKETRMRLASLLDDVRSAQDKRSALHQSYDDAIKKFKASKDSGSFKASVKKIDADYRNITHQIEAIVSQLKTQGSDVTDKVSELQRFESQYKEQVTLALQHAEKVVAGKMSRQSYDENDSTTIAKRDDISAKIDAVVDSL